MAIDDSAPTESRPAPDALRLFEEGDRVSPDSPAFHYFDATITHGEGARVAHGFAAALQQELGVAPGHRVALMMQNIPQMPMAVHATWLAGGVVTPVNVMNQSRELKHQLRDCGAEVLVCHESMVPVAESVRATTPLRHVVTVNELDYLTAPPPILAGVRRQAHPGTIAFHDLVTAHDGERVAVRPPAPESAALLTYTSGTTGLPKGAVNSHRAVAHNAEVWRAWYRLHPGDVTVALAPLFHITGLMGHMMAARASGSPMVLACRFDAGEMLRLIQRWRGTWAVGSLTAFIALMQHPDFGKTDLSSLTKVASGGAPVAPAVVQRFEAATGAYVHNAYGMTETTSTALLVPFGSRAPVDEDAGALSVGVPVAGAETRIVDLDTGVDVPHGLPGELLIRGPMVASGYWGRPGDTKAAMGDGWLRTGDVAVRDGDGWHWIIDRVKDVIIVSGYKVWPREVEDVLYEHPAVAEASVVGGTDAYKGERVIAHVVLRGGTHASAQDITRHCRANLAAYKAPSAVEFHEVLPKTLTGKILRRELRAASGE